MPASDLRSNRHTPVPNHRRADSGHRGLVVVAIVLCHGVIDPWVTADQPGAAPVRTPTVHSLNGAVVTVSAPASEAGLAVLKQGGSAIDAAVATAFALGVTWPEAGNIGGGGYLVFVPGAQGREPAPFAVDFREVAPGAATRTMFVDPAGRTPHRRVGVPGTVRGLAAAHAKHGKRPWKELLAPAVKLAEEGFVLDDATARSINNVLKTSDTAKFAELHRVFGHPDQRAWRAGDTLVQPDLAKTLRDIADHGQDAFYTGLTAALLVDEMRRDGGLITADDLKGYQAKIRAPVKGTYRGCDIYGSPPSSSGGTTLVLMLHALEESNLRADVRWSPRTLHRLAETMRRAYRERAEHLADPDFAPIPAKLTSRDFARSLAAGIDPGKATPSVDVAGSIPLRESEQTTHFSVVDRERNCVSLTYTLESSWGSRVVVPGAGFVLNDEMNDFNWLPGVTDATGRIGTAANEVAPGKRPLSSMCPTVVVKDGRPLLVTGSPGGRTIINTALQIVLNVVEFEMDARAAVDAPRMHHQWLPDRLRVEAALAKDHAEAVKALRALGHTVDEAGRQGDAHTIWIDPKTNEIVGAADTRISGHAAGW